MNITAEQLVEYVCARCDKTTQMLYSGQGKPPAYIACMSCAETRWSSRAALVATDVGPTLAAIRRPALGHP